MTRAPDQLSKTAAEIEQEATEWLVKMDRDGSPDTSRALAAWLGAHPRHRAAFLRISQAWQRANVLRRLRDPNEEPDPDLLAPERPPANESLTEPSHARPVVVKAARPHASPPRRAVRFAMAAAMAFLLIGTGVWVAVTAGTQTYATAIGEFQRITLADGSSVSLNTNTKVRVVYTVSQRRVELLRGEAQFEVAHDTKRPFVVAAGDTVVRDVGTVFDVRLRDQKNVDVLVSEGKVAINPPSRVTVSAGQMALVRNGKVITQSVNDITRRMAWMEGRLIFNGETLAEAVAEFNRYNRRQLVISDPRILGKRIGGSFRATSPERFSGALKEMFGVEPQLHEDIFSTEIRLYGGAP